MGCANCGTGSDGKPKGCKSNGGCSSGGCNRLNVYNWLNDLPLYDGAKPFPIIEVSFSKGSRKDFYRNNTHNIYEKGDWLCVEGVGGFDVGQVSLTGELVKLQMKKYGAEDQPSMKRVLRGATEDDLTHYHTQKEREPEVMIRARAMARNHKLEMKICEVELQADGKKGTFFYTADQRVDFRELIKIYASEFKIKVEMRQIGARQESGKVGGIGSCGRELCCSTWLTDFKSVNTSAARYQNLSINQTKLSGQCGRLKCCLNYELDTYLDALSVFPDNAESIQTAKGNAHLQKKDIFKNLMWYSYPDSSKQYPLSITRVKEIQILNRQGEKPDELQPVELETKESKAGIKVDAGFVNDVGQISLRSLERSSKKKKSKGQNQNRPQHTANADRQAGGQNNDKKPQQAAQQRNQQGGQQRQNRPQGGGQPRQGQPQQGTGNQPRQNRPNNNQHRQTNPNRPKNPEHTNNDKPPENT